MTLEPTLCCVAPISPDVLAHAASLVQAARDTVVEIRLHPVEYADLLRVGPGTFASMLTPDLASEMVRTGSWPTTLLGAEVTRDPDLDRGTVVVRGKTTTALVTIYR